MAFNTTLTWQHIDGAKRAMAALAAVEALGQRHIAEHAQAKAREVAAAISQGDAQNAPRPTSALEVLALKVNHPDGVPALYWVAAIAIELGLEPDKEARQEAQATLRSIGRA